MNKPNCSQIRSGIEIIKTFPGKEVKGSFTWRGFLCIIVGEDLIKITNPETGEFSIING